MDTSASSPEQGRRNLKLTAVVAIALMDQMAMQLEAGIPADEAVAALARECDDPKAQRMMAGVHAAMCREGHIAAAFGRFPRQFPAHVVEMIEVGHRAGRLVETFRSLSRHWDELEEARGVARKAMTYPAIAGVVTLGIATFLLGFVLPSFERVFRDLGVELPGLTKFYLGLSALVVEHTAGLLMVATAALALALCAWRSVSARNILERVLARLPGLASLVQALAVARLASNLSTLCAAGIPTQDALRVCANSTGNDYYNRAVLAATETLLRGDSLSSALQRTTVFPGLMVTSLRVGETSNRLPESLEKVRSYYSRIARSILQARLQWLEPMLTLGLGLFVGSIAVSLFYPMISLAMNIRR